MEITNDNTDYGAGQIVPTTVQGAAPQVTPPAAQGAAPQVTPPAAQGAAPQVTPPADQSTARSLSTLFSENPFNLLIGAYYVVGVLLCIVGTIFFFKLVPDASGLDILLKMLPGVCFFIPAMIVLRIPKNIVSSEKDRSLKETQINNISQYIAALETISDPSIKHELSNYIGYSMFLGSDKEKKS